MTEINKTIDENHQIPSSIEAIEINASTSNSNKIVRIKNIIIPRKESLTIPDANPHSAEVTPEVWKSIEKLVRDGSKITDIEIKIKSVANIPSTPRNKVGFMIVNNFNNRSRIPAIKTSIR